MIVSVSSDIEDSREGCHMIRVRETSQSGGCLEKVGYGWRSGQYGANDRDICTGLPVNHFRRTYKRDEQSRHFLSVLTI